MQPSPPKLSFKTRGGGGRKGGFWGGGVCSTARGGVGGGLRATKQAQKKMSAIGAMAPTPISLKTRGWGGGGLVGEGRIQGLGPASPPPPPSVGGTLNGCTLCLWWHVAGHHSSPGLWKAGLP